MDLQSEKHGRGYSLWIKTCIQVLLLNFQDGSGVPVNDQKRVEARSYIEYAPSLMQFDESQHSIHIDFELYNFESDGHSSPRIEYSDLEEHCLPCWITYY